MINRADIVRMAREYKGVPYRHQGRCAKTGVDCAGLLALIADRIGLEYPDNLRYPKNPEKFNLKSVMDQYLVPISADFIQPGDAMLFKIDVLPQHVAIAADYQYGGLSMIHCYNRVDRVVEHRLAKIWLSRLVQAYQIPEVEGGYKW